MLSFANNNLNTNARKVELLSKLIIIQRNHARTNGPIFPRRTQKLPRRIRYYVAAATPFLSRTRDNFLVFTVCETSYRFSCHQARKKKSPCYGNAKKGGRKIEGKSIRDRKRRRSCAYPRDTRFYIRVHKCDAGIGSDCINRPSACLSKTIDESTRFNVKHIWFTSINLLFILFETQGELFTREIKSRLIRIRSCVSRKREEKDKKRKREKERS